MGAYPKWTSTPACEGTDSESWFSDEETNCYSNEQTLRKICSNCPVRNQCFDYALRHNVHGYWAGTTPRRRQQMRVRLGIKAEEIYYSGQDAYGA